MYFFFFFSSRRRHTISDRDWSSDVCSSDLGVHASLDARMVQVAGDLALPHEALVDAGIGEQEWVRALEENHLTRPGVTRLVRLGVRPLSEGLDDLEAIQAVPRLQPHAGMLTGGIQQASVEAGEDLGGDGILRRGHRNLQEPEP